MILIPYKTAKRIVTFLTDYCSISFQRQLYEDMKRLAGTIEVYEQSPGLYFCMGCGEYHPLKDFGESGDCYDCEKYIAELAEELE